MSQFPLKILFVINPISGGKSKQNYQSAISEYFEHKTHSLEYFLLTGKNDAESIRNRIEEFQPDRIVAVGGDGTINLVAGIIMNTAIVMGIIPAGSANGLATELQLPTDVPEALLIVDQGIIRKMDILRINDAHLSLHLADIGINAQLIKYFDESNWRGKLGYAKVAFKTLWRKQKIRVSIETDTQTIFRKAFMVVIANSTRYGTGMVINPEGNPFDGKFEVVVIRKLALSEILKMIFLHKPFNPEKFEVISTSRVLLKTKRKTYFQSDGEYLGREQNVKVEMLEGAVNILLKP